jgi:hypothetical protein
VTFANLNGLPKPASSLPYHLPGSVIRKQVMLYRSQQLQQLAGGALAAVDAAETAGPEPDESDVESDQEEGHLLAASDAAKLRSMAGQAADAAGAGIASRSRLPLFDQGAAGDAVSAASDSQIQQGTWKQGPAAAAAAMEAFERKYPAYARGLLDSLVQLEDRNIKWVATADGAVARWLHMQAPASSRWLTTNVWSMACPVVPSSLTACLYPAAGWLGWNNQVRQRRQQQQQHRPASSWMTSAWSQSLPLLQPEP